MQKRKLKFANGVPVGSGLEPQYTKWRQAGATLDSVDSIMKTFSYKMIAEMCPWAKKVRAGIVLFAECSFLMVQENPMVYWEGRTRKILPPRVGFPKGSPEPEDKCAFTTAIRELAEETGIDLREIPAEVSPTVLTFPRSEVDELFIWFICFAKTQPKVAICPEEISGYMWVNPCDLRDVAPTTQPTSALIKLLEDVNFAVPGKSLPISIKNAIPSRV